MNDIDFLKEVENSFIWVDVYCYFFKRNSTGTWETWDNVRTWVKEILYSSIYTINFYNEALNFDFSSYWNLTLKILAKFLFG